MEKKPQQKTDFIEYSFDGGPFLKVPGDFNSQLCELAYFESVVWYKKVFHHQSKDEKRLFLHFGAVNYLAEVYLNGEKTGSHEGGFTPFQFEITDKVKEGDNILIVKVNNQRLHNGLPGLVSDWFNYGGITRDVNLIETNKTFIEDYAVQLKKGSLNKVLGWIQLNGINAKQKIKIKIPELNKSYKTESNSNGYASIEFDSNFKLWSPENTRPTDEAANWTEEYQKQIYVNQIELFKTIPNLCGTSPWLLFDYKSLGRMNQVYQKGYNRKGLLSEKGEKKKAWYIMNEYYNKNEN